MEKNNEFDIEYIKKIASDIAQNTVVSYEDLPRYDLFLSQVIDYLNDKFEDEKYTSNIVQNYIKGEVISKPDDGKKRGYTKDHLAQLLLLSYMRPILTTEEIKKVFGLAFNNINNRNDDILSWEKAYKIFSNLQAEMFNDFLSENHFKESKLKDIIKDNSLKGSDEERILVFLIVMSLIAQASAIKKLARKIVDEYNQG
ncbi:DUF1836 domain-containing protein [Clostridium sp. YIM B02515]|uniref:DUF1836 domain-containing protein n=1 Tax=Clostridium rhizosphaerae TaxID=2803861 RepID=A0ABS1TDA6_9CLOT|nr:DUF1836 domain-containing protein [Clostridium rhizosphaerae]MBL4937353.1 DUF1836 domain-containing protein [Clostridium rhizosphaerae]